MKLPGVISATSLFFLLGITAPANAWQEPQEKQEKQEKQEQPAKPAKQEQRAKPEQQEQAKAPKQEQQAKPEKQQEAKAPKQQQDPKAEKQQAATKQPAATKQQAAAKQQATAKQQPQQQQKVASTQRPQRTPQEETRQRAQPALRLSARGSGRISDARFRSNFGRGHEFHVGVPVLVGGYSRFHYGGYWFGFVEPWPVGWYYTDDVYIDYVDGGYYMYNPYDPGVRFALTVVI